MTDVKFDFGGVLPLTPSRGGDAALTISGGCPPPATAGGGDVATDDFAGYVEYFDA